MKGFKHRRACSIKSVRPARSDFALCDQGLTPTELTAILSNAFEMKQFERGIPRVVCGMSGDELVREIIVHAGLKPVEFREAYPFDRSPQY